jgi:hypothetical protein
MDVRSSANVQASSLEFTLNPAEPGPDRGDVFASRGRRGDSKVLCRTSEREMAIRK